MISLAAHLKLRPAQNVPFGREPRVERLSRFEATPKNNRDTFQVFLRTSISVLQVTLRLLNNIAVTATSGLSRPLMAMGILTAL